MTEDDAHAWVGANFGGQVLGQLEHYVRLLDAAFREQNLIARSTRGVIWSRHIVDSLQLIELAPRDAKGWLDVGTGAGLPGLVVGIATQQRLRLVEPRRLRTEFLARCVSELGVSGRIEIIRTAVERYNGPPAAIISARAVAALDKLFRDAHHLATPSSTWLLPRGANAHSEVDAARLAWHGTFHVKQSIVAAGSGIVVAHGVRRR